MSDPIHTELEQLVWRDATNTLDQRNGTADPVIAKADAALAEQQGEGPSDEEWKDIGDGRPVQVQRCRKCGVCPSNVDDCGHFGDSRCPYFGIDALAAPSAPEPVGEGPTPSDVTDLFYRHMGEGSEVGFENAIAEALARWGHQPTPPAELLADLISRSQILDPGMAEVLTLEARWDLYAGSRSQPPTEGEVAELVAALQADAECVAAEQPDLMQLTDKQLARAAELLQQQHPAPVPVAELPGPEDCDGEGRCWWGAPALFGTCTGDIPHSWRLCRPDDRFNSELVWLPATALPLPQGEVE